MSQLLISLLFLFLLSGQERFTLNGFVYDKTNGESLIGVNLYFKNTSLGTVTNNEGYFVLPSIKQGDYTLVVQYVGYTSTEIEISLDKNIQENIHLKMDDITGDVVDIVAEKEKKPVDVLYEQAISKVKMSAATIKQIPQVVEADLLRSLQTLPGIVSVSDFSSALYVRGGTPDQNLYLIDGADVYNPEHAFGLFSTFNTDAIKTADLSKGGFTADYGGRLSSVLDVINLDGNRKTFEGSASVSLLAAKTTLQFPLGDFGSVSGSIRRTYFDKLLKGSIENLPDYYFYDGNVKAFLDINEKNKISISYFGGRDNMDITINPDVEDPLKIHYDWGNKTGSLKWTHVFSPTVFSNFWTTASVFDSEFKLFKNFVTEKNEISDVTVKGHLIAQPSHKWTHKFGFEYKNIHGVFKQKFPGGEVDVDSRLWHGIAFYAANWKPSNLWEIEAGLRYNYFDSERTFNDVSPRFTAKYRLSENSHMKFATGRYTQYLHRIPRAFIADIWTASDKFQGGSSSNHFILGYQKVMNGSYEMEVETYYKSYNNIYQFNKFTYDIIPTTYNDIGQPVFKTTEGLFDRGEGSSRGFEYILKKTQGALNGWVAYSYTETEYRFDGINQDHFFAPRHDRNHVINTVLNFDWTYFFAQRDGIKLSKTDNEWKFGLNFIYSTGQPITTPSSIYHVNEEPGRFNLGGNGFSLYPKTINSYRLPAYIRLDLSATYEHKMENLELHYYLQVFNAGNRGNIWFISYEDEFNENSISQKVNTVNMFPLLPTLGIRIYF